MTKTVVLALLVFGGVLVIALAIMLWWSSSSVDGLDGTCVARECEMKQAGRQAWWPVHLAVFPPAGPTFPDVAERVQGRCARIHDGQCQACIAGGGHWRVLLCPSTVTPEAFENLVRIGEGRPRGGVTP